jgi:hypothetical protein
MVAEQDPIFMSASIHSGFDMRIQQTSLDASRVDTKRRELQFAGSKQDIQTSQTQTKTYNTPRMSIGTANSGATGLSEKQSLRVRRSLVSEH